MWSGVFGVGVLGDRTLRLETDSPLPMPIAHIMRPRSIDASTIDALCRDSVPRAYLPVVAPPLAQGLADPGGEEQVLIARDRVGGAITGFSLFGVVPGTLGAGRIRAIGVAPLARRRGVGGALLNATCEALRAQGARFVLVELPDEPEARFLWALLEAADFREEDRASELVRPGVAMRYVRRDFASS